MDSGLKHTLKATQDFFFRDEKRNFLQWPCQSGDLNPIKHAFYFMKAKPPKNKHELKTAAKKAWQGVTVKETQHVQ